MSTHSGSSETIDWRVRKAMSMIENDVADDVSLNRIAEEVNLSLSRLRHLFKDEIGMTPAQYIKSLRMKLAKEMAATTFLTVKEIVFRLGVTDESHFLRDFKRAFGLTISEYRESVAAKSANK